MRRSRVILIGALLVILAIFVFAFFGVGGGDSPTEAPGKEVEDKYHMKLRFPPKDILERDQKALSKEEGVDVVYFWTRPQDVGRLEEFETTFRNELEDSNSVGENMNLDFAQLQLYFARGLESFAPWFRKLIIIIPDSVDSRPFNSSDSRVRYVTHSDFIPEKSGPIFNWRSLLISFALWRESHLSRHFIVADDLTFPISYISPLSMRTIDGELRLPLYNDDVSTPLFDTEATIYKNSQRAVEGALLKFEEQLGFTNVSKELNVTVRIPKFETRGWSMLDRQVIADLNAICSETLEANRLHRMRRKDSVDLVTMHHIFIYWMRQLSKQPKPLSDFVRKFDADKDGFLSREELSALGTSLHLDDKQTKTFVENAVTGQSIFRSNKVELEMILKAPDVLRLLTENAVRTQFRHVLVPSSTVAIELRRDADLKLQKTLDILKSGGPTVLWTGPRILGPHGDYTREAMEYFLYRILKARHSTLESVYRPHPTLGLWIGSTYFLLFTVGTWLLTKCLLQKPTKSVD